MFSLLILPIALDCVHRRSEQKTMALKYPLVLSSARSSRHSGVTVVRCSISGGPRLRSLWTVQPLRFFRII